MSKDMEAGGHRLPLGNGVLCIPEHRVWAAGGSGNHSGETRQSTWALNARPEMNKALGRREAGPGLSWVGLPRLCLRKAMIQMTAHHGPEPR